MKILIVGHDLKFINFYIDYLNKKKHEVRIDKWENHVSHNVKVSYELLNWADIILCEWGLGNILFYSKNKRDNQKLIVRMHRQELETSYLSQANFDKIDNFVTVSPYIYEEFCRAFNIPRSKMHLIYNNVNLKKFHNKNNNSRKYKIGMVGYLPKLKRLDLALDVFANLYQKNNRYTLHFKGKRPEELRWLWRIDEEREFYEKQFERIENASWRDNVIFEPFGDVVEFYNKMEFILSISDVESFHLAAAEGIACGAVPIISNWEGSGTIYNTKFIVENLETVPDYISNVRNHKAIYNECMIENIKFFDEKAIINEMDKILFT